MDAEYASYYTKEVMLILIREFVSPDEEMKKIVLKASLKIAFYTYDRLVLSIIQSNSLYDKII